MKNLQEKNTNGIEFLANHFGITTDKIITMMLKQITIKEAQFTIDGSHFLIRINYSALDKAGKG